MVRACARYVLRQYGIETAPLYRALCAGGPVPRPRRSGSPSAARARTPPCCGTSRGTRTGVRAHAVAGLRVLDGVAVARLVPFLDDPAPGVVRQTVTALAPYADRLPVAELRARLGTEHPGTCAWGVPAAGRERRSGPPGGRLVAGRRRRAEAAGQLLGDAPELKARVGLRGPSWAFAGLMAGFRGGLSRGERIKPWENI
ncbi:hypothetical protein O1L60_07070 [Streptomyces diastatochromogenes]|nr:hypothetical protein [Streptomyces diastatochromogenes]